MIDSMRCYLELTKPRITWLILMSTAVGYLFGAREFHILQLVHTLVGTGLMASGTAALNQWYERDADGHMRRTARRPIPAGKIRPQSALLFGIAISAAGFCELMWCVNPLSAITGAVTLLSYLLVYTPMKSRSWTCTIAGAVPGALPPVIGFAAANGRVSREALIFFAILYVWQFPHFYSIAWLYREDYARGGIRMLPVVEPDGRSTARQIIVFAAALVPVSLLPAAAGMSGAIYTVAASCLGVWMLVSSICILERTSARARQVLLASVVYLPALYGFMVTDRLLRW